MNKIFYLMLIVFFCCFVSVAGVNDQLATPEAPEIKIIGAKGEKKICYWVSAENRLGELTDISPPVIIENAPSQLDEKNKIIIRIKPIKNAIRYRIYKTEILDKPYKVVITARTSPKLVPGDFPSILNFIWELKQKGQKETHTPAAYIWNNLSSRIQKALLDLPREGIPSHLDSGSQMRDIIVAMLNELNKQLINVDFYNRKLWSDVSIDPKLKKQLQTLSNLKKDQVLDVNRQLFDAVFPKYIRKWRTENPKRNYYYWIAAKNNYRWSDLGGPFKAENVDISKGVTMSWQPVTNATGYEIYRTNDLAPPLGRAYHLLAHQYEQAFLIDTIATRKEKEACSIGVGGYPATKPEYPPIGKLKALLAVTEKVETEDTGQPLKMTLIPNINNTSKKNIERPVAGRPSSAKHGNDLYIESQLTAKDRVDVPKFGAGSHRKALTIRQKLWAGGLSDRRHQIPYGYPGGKSSTYTIDCVSESETCSQHHGINMEMRNFGMGDAMPVCTTMKSFGSGNRDGGDEGQHLRREAFIRHPHQAFFALSADALKGSIQLKIKNKRNDIWGQAGAGRQIVNLSKLYNQGRIEYVKNVIVYGKDTNWTEEMTGQFISFDIDTFRGQQADTRSPRRIFYQIVRIHGPEKLQIRAFTGWSESCNLGYSRYIYDPETGKGPGILYDPEKRGGKLPVKPYTNDYEWQLIPAKRKLAARGDYIIVPGTYLDDPWFQPPNTINIEPLRQPWHKGDQLLVPMSPGIFKLARTMYYRGDFCPQDQVMGLIVLNANPQTIPSPAINVDPTARWGGFSEGLRVTLPDNGLGDGIRIKGRKARYGCIRVPVDLPALRFDRINGRELADIPFIKGNEKTKSVDFVYQNRYRKDVLFSVGPDGPELNENAVFKGNSRSRGQTNFSGDGQRKSFIIKFNRSYPQKPVIIFSTNQFARSRLVKVSKWQFQIDFENPPDKGENNVIIWWHAQM